MLLEVALERISDLAESMPRSRIDGFLRRVEAGQSVKTALILESLRDSEASKIMELADQPAFAGNGALLVALIEAAYRRREAMPKQASLVWTGPRLEPTIKYARTSVAVRGLVDAARTRIMIAGYHVSSETLGLMGLWSAIERGVAVEMLLDRNDTKAPDREIFIAKGIIVHSFAAAAGDYAKFHAKAIVSDGSRALVGSANFTQLGHTANIELGVFIEGEPAATLEAVLRSYIAIASSTGWVVTR